MIQPGSARHLSQQQLLDLIFTVGQYKMVAMALNSLGGQLDEGVPGFDAGADGGRELSTMTLEYNACVRIHQGQPGLPALAWLAYRNSRTQERKISVFAIIR